MSTDQVKDTEMKHADKVKDTVVSVVEGKEVSADKVKGTCYTFFRGRGFGFIKTEEAPDDVMVHWADIDTDDPFPFIERGTEVEFRLIENKGKHAAKEVTLADGGKIPVFTKPYRDREVNKDQTYKGVVKFYHGWKGFGFVTPDEEITWKDKTSEGDLFFSRDGVITSNLRTEVKKLLAVYKGTRVSFKVYKDKKGMGACEIKNEDETPIEHQPVSERKKRKREARASGDDRTTKKAKTKEDMIEEREFDEDENTYTGTVKFYRPKQHFGFINLSKKKITFKGVDMAGGKGTVFVRVEDIVYCSDEAGLTAGSQVRFKLYKDSKGLGACEVTNADGTPVDYTPENKESEAGMVKDEPVKPDTKAEVGKLEPVCG